jgi:hypothetical protein
MRLCLAVSLVLVAGCAEYTADDNDAFLKLFSTAMVDAASSSPQSFRTQSSSPDSMVEINQTLACPIGGNMGISGNFTLEVAPQTASGYADVALMMTLTDCADTVNGTQFTIEGAYELAMNGHATVTGGVPGAWGFYFSGGYDVLSGGNLLKHCSVQASLTPASGWTGQWCGYALN